MLFGLIALSETVSAADNSKSSISEDEPADTFRFVFFGSPEVRLFLTFCAGFLLLFVLYSLFDGGRPFCFVFFWRSGHEF